MSSDVREPIQVLGVEPLRRYRARQTVRRRLMTWVGVPLGVGGLLAGAVWGVAHRDTDSDGAHQAARGISAMTVPRNDSSTVLHGDQLLVSAAVPAGSWRAATAGHHFGTGDLDGDGRTDVIEVVEGASTSDDRAHPGADGALVRWWPAAATSGRPWGQLNLAVGGVVDVTIGDVTGDHLVDVSVLSRVPGSGITLSLWAGRRSGPASTPTGVEVRGPMAGDPTSTATLRSGSDAWGALDQARLMACDATGDGVGDLVLARPDPDRVRFQVIAGGARPQGPGEVRGAIDAFLPASDVACGDADGDGYADLVVRSRGVGAQARLFTLTGSASGFGQGRGPLLADPRFASAATVFTVIDGAPRVLLGRSEGDRVELHRWDDLSTVPVLGQPDRTVPLG